MLVREAKLVPQMLKGESKQIESAEAEVAKKLRYWKNNLCLKG